MRLRCTFFFAVSGLAVLCSPEAGAAQAVELSDAPPVVLVVRVGQNQEDIAREARFVTDLRLNIDDFSIEGIPSPAADFVEMPLGRQIALIKPLMNHRHAGAAMWLHAVSEEILLLQVVVLDTGRALVRLFEHSLTAGSEEALAATAAELLGTAYLFEPDKSKESRPIRALVETTRKQAGVQASGTSKWRFHITLFGRNGFLDHVGPSLRVGGFLGAERAMHRNFFLSLGIGGLAGPLGREGVSTLSGYEVNAKIDAFFGPLLRRLRFGPVITVLGGPASVLVKRPEFPGEDFSYWTVHAGIGAQLRAPLHEKVALKVDIGVSAAPIRLAVKLKSNDEVIFKDGILSAWVNLGMLFF